MLYNFLDRYDFQINRPFIVCYDDDADAAAAAAAAADKAAADRAAADDAAKNKDLIPQSKVNAILAEEKRKYQEQQRKMAQELENLKNSASLTAKEKEDLQARLDELNNSLLTKEELAKQERDKQEKKYQTDLTKVTQEMSTWRDRYTNESIVRSITDAASANDAWSTEPIVALLRPNTKLVEEKDDDGKPTGNLIPRVKFQGEDKEGKQVTLDLTVPEAVKQMKDLPNRYGNLFKSAASGGLGSAAGAASSGRLPDPRKMTMEEYMKDGRKNLGIK